MPKRLHQCFFFRQLQRLFCLLNDLSHCVCFDPSLHDKPAESVGLPGRAHRSTAGTYPPSQKLLESRPASPKDNFDWHSGRQRTNAGHGCQTQKLCKRSGGYPIYSDPLLLMSELFIISDFLYVCHDRIIDSINNRCSYSHSICCFNIKIVFLRLQRLLSQS